MKIVRPFFFYGEKGFFVWRSFAVPAHRRLTGHLGGTVGLGWSINKWSLKMESIHYMCHYRQQIEH